MNKTPLISFITITYNGLSDTRELIESLYNVVQSVSYEIIVVDNASKIDEASIINKEYPWVKAIRSEQNLGFSGGNNIGIKAAKGQYLFFINNDTFIKEDKIINLIEKINSNPLIGGISPKICYAAPPHNIQYAGYTPLTPITLRNQTIGNGACCNDKAFNKSIPTAYLHGAAMLIKKEVIEKVGLMPDVYFLYYEEVDWSTAMTKKGYSLWYEPNCIIYHKESQSTGQNSSLQVYYLTRNRLLYAYRNLRGINRILSIFYQIVVATPKNSLNYLIKGRQDLSSSMWKGVNGFFKLNK